MKASVVIFAGGIGERVKSSIPKQFLLIQNKPVIAHVIEQFQNCDKIEFIYIAILKGYEKKLYEIIKKYDFNKVKSVINGGKTGMETIYKLLIEMKNHEDENSIVLIHDGVRPVIDDETIKKCIKTCHNKGNAITVEKATETILFCNNEKISHIHRDNIMFAKAPQAFILKDIISYHNLEMKKEKPYQGIIDNCSLALSYDVKLNLVEGNKGNIKLTTKYDYFSMIGNINAIDYYNFFKNERDDYEKN